MKIVHGDLIERALDGHYVAVVHGCNCFNTLGKPKGIAKGMVKQWPVLHDLDKKTVKGDNNKLGKVSCFLDETIDTKIYNAYTQYKYGSPKSGEVYVDWDAVHDALLDVAINNIEHERLIGIPAIGCGYAGGKLDQLKFLVTSLEDEILKYLDEEFEGKKHIFELVLMN